MPDEIAVGVVGAGFGRYGLIPAFRRDPRCRVAALCTGSAETAARHAAALGIPHGFSDFSRMLTEMPLSAVAIAVPPRAQVRIADAALAAGVAVFAEKPLACDVDSAAALFRRATATGLANAVDFMFPELTTWQRARELLQAGAIGRVRHVMLDWRMESFDNARGRVLWKTDSDAGGGALSHFGSHALYNLEWLLGPIAGLSARLDSAPDLRSPGDTLVTAAVTFGDGVSGSLSLCNAAPHGAGHRIEVYGSAGALFLVNESIDPVTGFRLLHAARDDAGMTEVASEKPDVRATDEDPRVAPVARLVRRFLDAVLGGPPVRPSFTDGLRAQRLIETIRDSAARGAWQAAPDA